MARFSTFEARHDDGMARALRGAAVFEATKGVLVLLAATGALALVHADLHAWVQALVERTHLNPAAEIPRLLLKTADAMTPTRLVWLAVGGVAYALLRFVEAHGLYRQRAWGEWLAAVSGGVYLPFEVAALLRDHAVLPAVLLAANLVLVGIAVAALRRRRARDRG